MNLRKLAKNIFFTTVLIFSTFVLAENPHDSLNPDQSQTSAIVPALGSCKECISHFRDVKEPVLALDHKYNCYPLGTCKTSDSKAGSSVGDSSSGGNTDR